MDVSEILKLELDACASAAGELRVRAKLLIVSDDFTSISHARHGPITKDISGDFDLVAVEYSMMPNEIQVEFQSVAWYIDYGRHALAEREATELSEWYLKLYENTKNMRHDYWLFVETKAEKERSITCRINGKKGAAITHGDERVRKLVSDFIQSLAMKRDWMGEIPHKDLWPEFWGLLDAAGLSPRESADGSRMSWVGGAPAGFSFKAFSNRISDCRKGAVKK